MDEFLDGLDCRLRGLGMVADSIMMGIVNSTMEEAFEKACSKEGVLERLNEKSRFCELAVMQLEWCLKFVKEETDSYVVVESVYERERLVTDLTETRDRIQRRLEETEFAILEKDRLLIERFENEMKLRQALELKDRELMLLQSNLEAEKMKSEEVHELINGGLVSINEGRDGDFCELKNSVDEQFFHIKQKLEDERMNFTNEMRKISPRKSLSKAMDPDLKLVEEKGNCRNDDKEIRDPLNCCVGPELGLEKMGSDIDILKETLDIAFGMMSNAISLSEVRPMERQWRWSIEKDIVYTVVNGFAKDVQDFLNMKEGETSDPVVMSGENWSQFMDDITSLRHELDQLVNEIEEVARTCTGHDCTISPSEGNFGGKLVPRSPEVNNNVSSALDRYGKQKTSSTQIDEKDQDEEAPKDDSAGQGSLVAEMIRNHESIIRKKSEELNWLKGEIIREKLCSSVKNDTDSHMLLKKRIQDVIIKLDNVINTKMITRPHGGGKCVNCRSIKMAFKEEMRKKEQEKEDSSLRIAMIEEIYAVVFGNLTKDLGLELHDNDMEDLMREDLCKTFFGEIAKEWNEKIEIYVIQNQIREDIFQFLFSEVHSDFLKELDNIQEEAYQAAFHETVKYMKWAFGFASIEHHQVMFGGNLLENLASENKQVHGLKCTAMNNMRTHFLREIIQECNEVLESIRIESVFKEDISNFIFNEAIKDVNATAKITRAKCQKAIDKLNFQNEYPSSNMFQTLECPIKEGVSTVFLQETIKEWKMEIENNHIGTFIKEDVFQICIREAVKDFNSGLTKSQDKKPKNSERDLWSTNEVQTPKVSDKDNLMRKSEYFSRCIEKEKVSLLSASSEIMEQSRLIGLAGLENVELNERTKYHEEISVRADEVLCSANLKLKMARNHVDSNMVQLRECISSLGMTIGEVDMVHIGNKEALVNTWRSFMSTVTEISKEIEDFEHMVHRKMASNFSRLEEVKQQLDLSVEHFTSLRRKELLYRKAFLNRCSNLQKAETEVDLLGDEVDALLGLLEKLYKELYQYSPVLKNYFGVMDILTLIKKELEGPNSRH